MTFAVVKLGDRHAKIAKRQSGERTFGAPATTHLKEVVDVESIPEPMAPTEKRDKRKGKAKIAPEKSRKKIQTISLAKNKKEECVTDIRVLPEDEPNLCILHGGSTLLEPESEKKIEDFELEAKTVLPQV